MSETWGPSFLGKLFTSTESWSLNFDEQQYHLQVGQEQFSGDTVLLEQLSVAMGQLWAEVAIPFSGDQFRFLDGIPNAQAQQLLSSVARTTSAIRYKQRVTALIEEFNKQIHSILKWFDETRVACKNQLASKGWLTQEFKNSIKKLRPTALSDETGCFELQKHIEQQPQHVREAIAFWQRNFDKVADEINNRHLAKALMENRDFFDQVEKAPLTEEQATAVVCLDNRVMLVASAGSGKTSTMVAKAGYVLKNGYFPAEHMLLLAFNNDAAAELRERIKARLQPLGLPADKVVAKTFHAFGLEVIGTATGKRPSLAPWVENGRDIEALLEIVDDIKDRDPQFRTGWDLFRVVMGQDLPKFGEETDSPDSWDFNKKRPGFWTLNNEVVKSQGEALLANWFFYNGIRYQYEVPYQYETADASHRQYCPDFYFPDIDTYLEHWAVDENGKPPAQFAGYQEGIDWKRKLHLDKGTRLLETTMAELWSGKAFLYLEKELSRLGLRLDPNSERPATGRKPIENPRLAKTFRTFLTHTKSNRLAMAHLRERLGSAGQFKYRHALFLDLFEKIWVGWESKLQSEKCIDFDDMLNQASDCIEQGKWHSPYELVMVDEFQDVSQARAQLIAGLMKDSDRYLFAVGDDWQSINRFAGADLSVMTDFEARFGRSITLKLETTFRCPQSLCDISSKFVQKNPRQIRKEVRSARQDIAAPISIIGVEEERKIRAAISQVIEKIAANSVGQEKVVSVFVLGRYNKDKVFLPLSSHGDRVNVQFVTVHSSKGLEADHVIIPKMTAETLGFPSQIEDDPVLQLAMPGGDTFASAEERRLFYVALTRAKSTVTLITLLRKESSFVLELVRDFKLAIHHPEAGALQTEVCPECGQGFLVAKKGKFGPFLGCSQYPKCRFTRKTEKTK